MAPPPWPAVAAAIPPWYPILPTGRSSEASHPGRYHAAQKMTSPRFRRRWPNAGLVGPLDEANRRSSSGSGHACPRPP
eukprot:6466705-Amphidinium_carterae.4